MQIQQNEEDAAQSSNFAFILDSNASKALEVPW